MVLAKIEHAGKILAEPKHLECNINKVLDMALPATLNCSIANPADLDELASAPLIGELIYTNYGACAYILGPICSYFNICTPTVSVIEVLPKEKKAKEDKTVTIGMATIDLSPLLQGILVCNETCMPFVRVYTTYITAHQSNAGMRGIQYPIGIRSRCLI